MSQTILLVGASVRAAAASALRAGFTPWCVDLFADADLTRACSSRAAPLNSYPQSLFEALATGPPGPWMYTGGLENYPEKFAGTSRELWGNDANVVRRVRDPRALVDLDGPRLGEFPACLVKPRRGSGGLGIRPWHGKPVMSDEFLQEWIPGQPAAAVYVGIAGRALCLGATRQLVGCDWLHVPSAFQYAGSIGPIFGLHRRLNGLGQTLVDRFGLRGIFGVDLILEGERVRPIEVNPRYPASFEILERAHGRAMFAGHARAFSGSRGGDPWDSEFLIPALESGRCHGKAIYYAPRDFVVPRAGPWSEALEREFASLDTAFADIPRAGQLITRGEPVVTFFASGETIEACETDLRKIANDLDRVVDAG